MCDPVLELSSRAYDVDVHGVAAQSGGRPVIRRTAPVGTGDHEFRRWLYATLSRSPGLADAADDIQDAMLALYRTRPALRGTEAVAFCRYVIKCRRVDRLRRQKLVHFVALDDSHEAPIESAVVGVGVGDLRALLEVWCRERSDVSENVFLLLCAIAQGIRTNRELARHLGTSPAMVRRRRRRAVALLLRLGACAGGRGGTAEMPRKDGFRSGSDPAERFLS